VDQGQFSDPNFISSTHQICDKQLYVMKLNCQGLAGQWFSATNKTEILLKVA
jgi:hypothetical protein